MSECCNSNGQCRLSLTSLPQSWYRMLELRHANMQNFFLYTEYRAWKGWFILDNSLVLVHSTQRAQQPSSVIIITIVDVSCLYFARDICFLIIFSNVFSDVHQPLSKIRISLSGSLGAAQVLFLGGINFTESAVRKLFLICWISLKVPCFFSWDTPACASRQK